MKSSNTAHMTPSLTKARLYFERARREYERATKKAHEAGRELEARWKDLYRASRDDGVCVKCQRTLGDCECELRGVVIYDARVKNALFEGILVDTVTRPINEKETNDEP